VLEAARAAKASARPTDRETAGVDLLLDALASLLADGRGEAAPLFRRAILAFRQDPDPRWMGLAGHLATDQWDDESTHILADRRVDLARTLGALTMLPAALSQLAGYEILAGRFDVAEGHLREAGEISAATANTGIVGGTKVAKLMIAAWHGDHAAATGLAEVSIIDATARGQGILVSFAGYALAVLENGLGNYHTALTAAQDAVEGRQLRVAGGALSELVEAAVRSGEHMAAVEHAKVLSELALPSGTDWALGMLARSRALVARNSNAEALYEESIAHLKRCRVAPELARTRLLYGEWLRRKRRRVDAREQLRAAHDALSAIGARGFAERAEVELRATGERLRRRTVENMNLLTPQEETITRLVAEGASNGEVAAKLFVSPRTVEYHLGKIFRKLRVSSRTELIADAHESGRNL
jgi:DNA-binding CsgD family transcriptional regulator